MYLTDEEFKTSYWNCTNYQNYESLAIKATVDAGNQSKWNLWYEIATVDNECNGSKGFTEIRAAVPFSESSKQETIISL